MGDPVTGALYLILTSSLTEYVIIRTILINVLLGSFSFEEDGIAYLAID